jgi:hypothetical protein
VEVKFIIHVFWSYASCISNTFNYKTMKNQPRTTQDVLAAEQEDHRETRESVNAFNTEIQAFMAVRNNNTFIVFLTFSDMYVCFTLFTLQVMFQRISDVGDIPVPTWQPPLSRSRLVPQWSPWPSSGSSAA